MENLSGLSRRDRRRLATRAEILVAARELLLEVGPEALSLRQVARRADFSPAALYTYFPSRDRLVASLFAESFERLDAYLRRVPADLPPERRVVELGLAYMEFARENPMDLRCILLSTSLDLPPSSGKAFGPGRGPSHRRDLPARGQRRGSSTPAGLSRRPRWLTAPGRSCMAWCRSRG